MTEVSVNTGKTASDMELYELAFHFLPTLSEEEVKTEATTLRNLIEGKGGVIKVTMDPMMKALAYVMEKRIAGKKEKFGNAYFGSFAFEMEREHIPTVAKMVADSPSVLRHLLIELPAEALIVRERPLAIPTGLHEKKDGEKAEGDVVAPISEAELDKTIENLIVE